MYPNFTGSARRPRQVNLSGRQNPNPFAKPGATSSPHNALANAQQTRLARQQERLRAQAATSVQRVWRGYLIRKRLKAQERTAWDIVEQHHGKDQTESLAHSRLVKITRFYDRRDSLDLVRLRQAFSRLQHVAEQNPQAMAVGNWPKALLGLENLCLANLEHPANPDATALFFDILRFISQIAPNVTAENSAHFYATLRLIPSLSDLPLELLVAPLSTLNAVTVLAYQNLARHLLTLDDLRCRLGGDEAFAAFAGVINCTLLTAAVAELLRADPDPSHLSHRPALHERSPRDHVNSSKESLWLLGHLIYLNRHAFNFDMPAEHASGQDYTFVVATLLSSVTDDMVVEPPIEGENAARIAEHKVVDPFLADQITSLVNQDSIRGLLSWLSAPVDSSATPKSDASRADSHSRVLAGFILTLIRLFPRRGDDIRMWLYLGSSRISPGHGASTSIIQYFWQSIRHTVVFREVCKEPRATVGFLKSHQSVAPSLMNKYGKPSTSRDALEDQWRVVLLFVELYSFVLKVMDDEEFFTEAQDRFGANRSGRANSLSLEDIKSLSTFLKHLGFAMYYHAADILDSKEEEKSKDISSLFKGPAQQDTRVDLVSRHQRTASIHGVSLDHMKGAVTGLLRAIYERDSRRPFLPKDHWLMTSRFDMTNFIDAVVEEEEKRDRLQVAEDEDEEEEEEEEAEALEANRTAGLVGTGHAQRLLKFDQMRRQQRKASRRRYLQAVAPRLEILQNMPFLIPFMTRVQIFRRFVHMDQIKRHDGDVNPDLWRLSHRHGMDPFRQMSMERHPAKVRRGHEFDDAYDQYFDLGAELKDPINITFVDQFDQPEAGIDGGGVTKEFLTSVTNQAFSEGNGITLFVENEKHLMFPNPSAVEEQKELLREGGFKEQSSLFRAQISDLLQRYEFLGRIIGKCLYEGILVDIGFAGFFLLKWALTGGTGSAPRESGYRANLNDLRDYDEGLYQGLIQLKNHPGDVEDFALNFTVTDTLTLPPSRLRDPNDAPSQARTKTITRELKPNGSQIPVTNANRLVYISYMARHRLTSQPYAQTSAFLRGLGAMVPPSWLSMFNQTELQTLVGGAPTQINVADLRANTVYGGLYVIGDDGLEHDSVRIFWDVMEALPDEDRRKVLKFVTSTPRAPLLGFGSLAPRFSIRDSGDDDRLPSTSTCVNLLKLPRYVSRESCRKKLLQAVNSGAGFDLS